MPVMYQLASREWSGFGSLGGNLKIGLPVTDVQYAWERRNWRYWRSALNMYAGNGNGQPAGRRV